MAASSSSSSSSQVKKFHVFPSFHGPDVRRGFLSHLHDLFARKEITIFKDQEIERGHTIGSELVKAIREARLSIVLLSKKYASSSWCLDELVEILKCREDQGQIVMPVFYDVDPSHVRKQSGDFGNAFMKNCQGKADEVKQRWSKALTDVANIAGEHSRNWTDEAAMVQKLSTDVSNKLRMEEINKDFRECDVDKNGFITAAELRYVLTKDGEEFTDEQVRDIIRVADVDGDGQINYDEFVKLQMLMMADEDTAIEKLSTDIANKLRVEEMKEEFRKYDVDKNGFITAAELRYAMTVHGEKVTDEQVEEIIRKADVDGDGQLNYDEFAKFSMAKMADEEAAMVRKFATNFTLSREEEKEMKETFTVLDVDDNGFITAAEFQYVMKNSGSKLTEKEVRNFFRRADVDGDGQLNYDEFVKVMMATRRSADEEAARVQKISTDVLNKVNRFVKFMVKALS